MGKSKAKNSSGGKNKKRRQSSSSSGGGSLFGPISVPTPQQKKNSKQPPTENGNNKGSSSTSSNSKNKGSKGKNESKEKKNSSKKKKQIKINNNNSSSGSSSIPKKSKPKKSAKTKKTTKIPPKRAVGPNHHFKHKIHGMGGLPHHVRGDTRGRRSFRVPIKSMFHHASSRHFQLHMPPLSSLKCKCTDMPWYNNNSSIRPVVDRDDNDYREEQPKEASDEEEPSSCSSSRFPFGSLFQETFLSRLDQEMMAFAKYICLSPEERDAREHFIQHVANHCGVLFESGAGSNGIAAASKNKRQRGNSNNNSVSLQAFGSHATPSVCCFASDVDLALWGVVPAATHTKFEEENINNKREERIDKWRQALAQTENANDKITTKDGDEPTTAVDQPGEKEGNVTTTTCLTAAAVATTTTTTTTTTGAAPGAATTADPATVDLTKATSPEKDAKEESDGADNNNNVLFVIDRVGDEDYVADGNSFDEKANNNEEEKAPPPPPLEQPDGSTVNNSAAVKDATTEAESGTSLDDPLKIDDNANDNTQESGAETSETKTSMAVAQGSAGNNTAIKDASEAKPGSSADDPLTVDDSSGDEAGKPQEPGSSKEAPLVIQDNDSSSQTAVDLCSDSSDDDNDDSEADSADKLQAYSSNQRRKRSHSDVQPTDDEDDDERWKALVEEKQRTVSLSSSVTSGDDDDDDYDDDMQVSFVSRAPLGAAASAPTIGPTGQTRKLVVGALQSLGRKLRRSPLTHMVEVRRFARVPIISMVTNLGFEADVAIGGHNGTDTSQYASIQSGKYQSFSCVVLLLKILLIQQGLDKPFTGGLGSYKLYVLVAHHLEKHVQLGGLDRPAEILLGFFFRYGNVRNGASNIDSGATTRLSQNVVLRSEGGSADLQPVFHIDQCIRLFNLCWERLRKTSDDDDTASDSSGSLLGSVIDATRLRHDRDECLRKAAIWRRNHHSSHNNKTNSGGRKVSHVFQNPNSRETLQQLNGARDNGDDNSEPATDDEANRLMAGYGLQRGPHGGLIPRQRPDVQARKATKLTNPHAEMLGRARKNRKNKKKQNRDQALSEFANRELSR